MTICTCQLIRVGNRPPDPDGPRAIRDDCPEHGVGTAYYAEKCAEANARMRAARERKR